MKILKKYNKFNEAAARRTISNSVSKRKDKPEYNLVKSIWNISKEDIEDYLLELTDVGFEISRLLIYDGFNGFNFSYNNATSALEDKNILDMDEKRLSTLGYFIEVKYEFSKNEDFDGYRDADGINEYKFDQNSIAELTKVQVDKYKSIIDNNNRMIEWLKRKNLNNQKRIDKIEELLKNLEYSLNKLKNRIGNIRFLVDSQKPEEHLSIRIWVSINDAKEKVLAYKKLSESK